MNSINVVLCSSVSFDLLLFLRKVFSMLLTFPKCKKVSDIAVYSRHHCYHLEKKSIPSLFCGWDGLQSRVNCNQPTVQRSMNFLLQFHSRWYELSYTHSSIHEHNRKQAEIPVRWDFILVDWLMCSKVHSRGLVWNFCRTALPINNLSLQIS